jgi:hypothetical protein
MNLDAVAVFLLGIIVGQWIGVLISLKVIRAMVAQVSNTPAGALEPSTDASPIARLIYRQLLGPAKPRGNQAKRAPPPKKKSQTRSR